MGINKLGQGTNIIQFAERAVLIREEDLREEDLKFLDQPYQCSKLQTLVEEKIETPDAFPTVTQDSLCHLIPGCFVLVGEGEGAYWVEIGKIEGDIISGILHPELSGALCIVDHDSCAIARFQVAQITAYGCDRYCWC